MTAEPVVQSAVVASVTQSMELPKVQDLTVPSPNEVKKAATDTFNGAKGKFNEAKDTVNEAKNSLPKVDESTPGQVVKELKSAGWQLPPLSSNTGFLETEVTSSSSTSGKCTSACVNKCIKTTKDKAGAIDCLTSCDCFQDFSTVEMMQVPEASLLANGRSGTVFGYLIFCLFLSGIILFTGYLVVERDGKKKVRLFDEEENIGNPLYQRLD